MSDLSSPADRASPTIRCLLGMLGTDVHNKGIRTLAQMLRDHGIEIIYLGEHNTCEGMTQAIIAEDADLVGLSYSSSNYLDYTRQLIDTMREQGVGDVPVMLGGLIHPEDSDALRQMGVSGIFGPGSKIEDILDFIHRAVGRADEPAR
ncbi:MAG: cobalamin-dependent protein [Halieaceae bacterium]|nr:cobalamin-dependent protein [Halieaceae bacterium]